MEGKGPLKGRGYSAFVFDLDGTLVNLPVDWLAVRHDLAEAAGETIDGTPLFSKLAEILARRPQLRPALFGVVDAHESRAAEAAAPIPGALELVRSLEGRHALGLVTMQGRLATGMVLDRFSLRGCFRLSLTREDSLDRAEQLLSAVRGLDADPASVLFVGDRLNDVVSARRARVGVAIVGREITGQVRPDYEFRDYSGLRAALG